MNRAAAAAAPALALTLAISGCAAGGGAPTLVVYAASSLSAAFTEIGAAYSAAEPGTALEQSFAGSADLLTQLTGGARADVLATADARTMARAQQAGLLSGEPVSFATNTLTLAVAPGNPKGVKGFRDLPGLATVVCAPQVPCGAALPEIEANSEVALDPVSEETSVTGVLEKVATGQADAGVVYTTDVRAAAGRVAAVPFPEAAGAVNTYRIAVLADAPNPQAAARFVALVTGPRGREALSAAGFGRP